MPIDRSRFTYRRDSEANEGSTKAKKGNKTWTRTLASDQAAIAKVAVLSKAGPLNIPQNQHPTRQQQTLSGQSAEQSRLESTSDRRQSLTRGPHESEALALAVARGASHMGRANAACRSTSLYTKKRPHQLQRLATPRTKSTPGQLGLDSRVTSLIPQGSGVNKPSPGVLVHQGKHSLVRRSSGSIISAVARTVAAARTPRSLPAFKRWSRTGQGTSLGGMQPASRQLPSRLAATSLRWPPRSSHTFAGKSSGSQWPEQGSQIGTKTAFKWSRVKPGALSVRTTPVALRPGGDVLWQRSEAARGKSYKSLRTSSAARIGPGKLVRMGGSLYRVSGVGRGRSLKRQTSPKSLPRPSASQPLMYRRSGRSLRKLVLSPAPSATSNPLHRLRRGMAIARLSAATPQSKPQSGGKAAKLSVVAKIRKRSKFYNRVCYTFCRTGKCADKAVGVCPLVHDQDKVAVCSKWLNGRCKDPECPLQHTLRPQLMPMCEHFAQGTCNNLDCPYLHVLLDEKAPVCKEFAKGYCPKGASCLSKHLSQRQVMSVKAAKTLTRKAEDVQEAPIRKRRRWPLPLVGSKADNSPQA